MKKITPSLPAGMRDFSPEEIFERKYIIDIMKNNFQKHGFVPIETPSMEKLSILTEKYGEEGDKLIFKILNSGDYLKKTDSGDYNDYHKLSKKITEKALRYDLTIPFARYISMNREKHPLPFKRYQIQPVWRADRPQKGRYREFYQCDVDIIGTKSIIAEAELISMASEILEKLKIPCYKIKINHRGLLKSFAEYIEEADKEVLLATIIDKIDKIGIDKALDELKSKNIDLDKINLLKELLLIDGSNENKLNYLEKKLKKTLKTESINELKLLLKYLKYLGTNMKSIIIDPTIARGLAYYTGTVFEIIVENSDIGSIGGGGRYDDMASMFGLKNCSGIGFAFGLDRIWNILKDSKLIPNLKSNTTKILVTNFDKETLGLLLNLTSKLRQLNINTELYPSTESIKKQLTYANKRNIPYVIIIGSEEKKKKKFILKDMNKGIQNLISIDKIENILKVYEDAGGDH